MVAQVIVGLVPFQFISEKASGVSTNLVLFVWYWRLGCTQAHVVAAMDFFVSIKNNAIPFMHLLSKDCNRANHSVKFTCVTCYFSLFISTFFFFFISLLSELCFHSKNQDSIWHMHISITKGTKNTVVSYKRRDTDIERKQCIHYKEN